MEIKQELKDFMSSLAEVNFKDLERTEELGRDYSFKEQVKVLKQVYKDLQDVIDNALALRLPDETESRVTELARRLNQYVKEISSFVLKGNEPNASSQHKQIHNNVNNLYQDDLKILPELIERASILKLKPSEVEGQLTKATASMKEIEKIKSESIKSKDNIDSAIKEIRDTFGKEGSLVSGADFERQAVEHRDLAKKWFVGVISAIGLTVLMVVVLFSGWLKFFNLSNYANDLAHIVQASIFRVVLLSIAYLLIHQTLKNYKVNRHLYVINKHRQLALAVYPLMTKATSDQDQSNLIVTQAAKAIFEQSTTGYLDGTDDNMNPINLTEVINKIVEKGK